jgi:general stress protein 26
MTVAMLMTMVGREHTSRPVTVAETTDDRLSFLVAGHTDWVRSIAGHEALVHVTISDHDAGRWLSLNGAAAVVVDRDEIRRLWNPAARAWFDGPDDPELAVVRFDVSDGHYWDGPSTRAGRAVSLLKAALTGHGDSLGSSGPISTARSTEVPRG